MDNLPSILLVNSPYPRRSKFYGQPTSLLYAASLLAPWMKERNLTLELVNYNSWNYDNFVNWGLTHFANTIAKLRPQMVCISLTSSSLSIARSLAKVTKECSKAIVVFGGPHEDDVLTSTVEFDDNVDISCSGDGESALLVLAKLVMERGSYVPKISDAIRDLLSSQSEIYGEFRLRFKGGDLIASSEYPSKRKLHLNELPTMPRYLVNDADRYLYPIFHDENWQIKPTAQVMTQRGCVAKCDFCSESQKLSSRSIESVSSELSEIKSAGYEAVFFDDSTFTNKSVARRRFIEAIGAVARTLKLDWGCQTRIDTLDDGLCKELQNGGCKYVYFGLETVHKEFLRSLGKTYSLNDVIDTLVNCRKNNIMVGTSLILGTPDKFHRNLETVDTARATFDFVRRFIDHGPVVLASINLFGYYPSTLATLSLQSQYPNLITEDSWKMTAVEDRYPFNLLEELPSVMPFGLLEVVEPMLILADQMIGDVLIGQDQFTSKGRVQRM